MSATAWVTGSAGGIGSAICRRFTAEGLTVVGLDAVPSPDADVSIVVDLADGDAIAAAAEQALAVGEVATVVHVAATQPMAGAGETGVADWTRTLAVNVVALDLLVGFARESLSQQRGSIVAVGSVHGQATTHGITAYATSKAAIEGWVRASAIDLAPAVRVNCVVPGAIDTAKLAEGFARWGDDADTRRTALEQRTPLGRIGAADDVADAVAFLAGPNAGFITGAVLAVDGGALTRLGTE